jgi:hypothetical protein
VSSFRSCAPLVYSDNECVKQLLYALDDLVWGMKITTLKKSVDFDTLDTKKLFSKLKSHELSHKDHPNHDVSPTSKALITSARVGSYDANSTNIISSSLEFALSSLAVASNKQYESIPTKRLPCWQESFTPCTSFTRRGGGHLGAASSAATSHTSSPTASRGRSSTLPTSMTTPTRITSATRAITRKSTASEI